MKKKYESPTLEITVVNEKDIICTSGLDLISIGTLGHDTINFGQLNIEMDLE